MWNIGNQTIRNNWVRNWRSNTNCARRSFYRIVRCVTGEKAMNSPSEFSSPMIDLAQIRQRLAAAEGPTYWRSLEELSGTPEFVEAVEREFPAWKERLGDAI